jgi:hypothetical protein
LLLRTTKEGFVSWKRLSQLFQDKTPRDVQCRWFEISRRFKTPEPPAAAKPAALQEMVVQKAADARGDDHGALDLDDSFWLSLVDHEPFTSFF